MLNTVLNSRVGRVSRVSVRFSGRYKNLGPPFIGLPKCLYILAYFYALDTFIEIRLAELKVNVPPIAVVSSVDWGGIIIFGQCSPLCTTLVSALLQQKSHLCSCLGCQDQSLNACHVFYFVTV